MANPFEVRVPNAFEALLAGDAGYQSSQDWRKRRSMDSARSEAERALASGGDTRSVIARLLSVGDTAGANAIASIEDRTANREWRQTEAERAQRNADRSFGLQAGARDLARQQFEWQRSQGSIKTITDANGNQVLVRVDQQGNATPINTGVQPVASNVPPGVDPATYRREQAQAAVKSEADRRALNEGGAAVLGMVERLERKIMDPADPNVANRFGAAAGPFAGPASDAGAYDPRKLAYEAIQSRDSKAYLEQIKQDAQAINAAMQRALLKGQGSASNEERAQINQILGSIASARSPQHALAALNNFKGIARKLFQMPDEPAAQRADASGTPPPPPGFVMQ